MGQLADKDFKWSFISISFSQRESNIATLRHGMKVLMGMKSTKFGLLTTANPLLQVNDQAIARQQWFCEEILLGGLMACNHISSKWSYKWKPNILWGASEIGIHQLNERFEVSSSCPQKMGKNKFAMFSRELNYKYGNQKSTT